MYIIRAAYAFENTLDYKLSRTFILGLFFAIGYLIKEYIEVFRKCHCPALWAASTVSFLLIGTFTITAYCGCSKCGTGSNRTAMGTTPTEGRTIAADTSILPFGTQVVIGGVVYTVEDTGSGVRGNHIDIFFATHAKALQFGRKTMKVYKY